MDRINEEEVEAECREKFDIQEREKERKQDEKGQKWPKKRASWEVFWKNNMFKKIALRGGVDNLRYMYKVLKLLLIPFQKELIVQRYKLDEFECNILPYVF